MTVLVVGAGIGGLTAALSLHAAGIEVHVAEAARTIEPLGVGINLLPHAVRELTELGLGDALADAAVATGQLAYYDRFGGLIWREPRGVAAGYRWPQFSIHRGALQLLLLDAVGDRLGPEAVTTGVAFEHFSLAPGTVEAVLRDRARQRTVVIDADVLVGADGIHSAVRAQLHPAEGPPRGNGIHMWRGITQCDPFLDGRTMIMAGSNHRAKFVAYPIAESAQQAASVNWVAEVRLGEEAPMTRSNWQRPGRLDDVLPHFADWRFPWLDIPELMTGCGTIFEYPMVDRDPLPAWGAGPVTLLGDAAHPMYPIGSNGASQAIIDARFLASRLRDIDRPQDALAAYESARRPATNALVVANRQLGPERVLRIVEQRAPQGFQRIEDIISAEELTTIANSYKQAAGFDIETLNSRPAW